MVMDGDFVILNFVFKTNKLITSCMYKEGIFCWFPYGVGAKASSSVEDRLDSKTQLNSFLFGGGGITS